MSAVAAQNVSRTYGEGHTAVNAVQGVSFSLAPGEIVLIMGPSGSGKTTLLTLIGALLRPTSGSIDIGGEHITASQLPGPSWRRREIGFIFQSFNLLSALTAEQNAMVPLLADGWARGRARKRANELLDRLGLGERKHALPKNLSGGEKQRVAIARALANSPQLLLADEPTANLDSKIGHEVAQLLCEIACVERRAVIIVSHDPRLKDVAHRVLTMEDGRFVAEERGGHDRTCQSSRHSPIQL